MFNHFVHADAALWLKCVQHTQNAFAMSMTCTCFEDFVQNPTAFHSVAMFGGKHAGQSLGFCAEHYLIFSSCSCDWPPGIFHSLKESDHPVLAETVDWENGKKTDWQ